jgi:hypothetical protein
MPSFKPPLAFRLTIRPKTYWDAQALAAEAGDPDTEAEFTPMAAPRPTNVPPGAAKIAVFQRRLAAGEDLWNVDDEPESLIFESLPDDFEDLDDRALRVYAEPYLACKEPKR